MTICRSNPVKVHRAHNAKEGRWMHEPDEIIPTAEPGLTLRDWMKMMAFTFVMGAVLFAVWWFGG